MIVPPFLSYVRAAFIFIKGNGGALIRIYATLLVIVFVAEFTAATLLTLSRLQNNQTAWLLAQAWVIVVSIAFCVWSISRLFRRS
ncbi:hypothetical protein HNR26_004897 [Rhizobium rosettiformans]|uniref:Uncharacterized protein n=3 Tax=Rhizobium rosettiformans TaxID=1368430 RepID=A0A4V6T6D0_9HYPH|nr:hypothetical protein [Rhizobium rosettiformans]MBB5278783.1 hypothetical protein [Rhizobium rosettiformans]THV28906.1 hypothetical protein FAA86_23880 [Rhizobium rosettiformans W3]